MDNNVTETKKLDTCPKCGCVIGIHPAAAGGQSFTSDCPECGGLLLFEDGKAYDFHAKLHSECPRWPKDGRGTASIEV